MLGVFILFFRAFTATSSVVDETICSQRIFINKIYYLPFLHKNHLPFLNNQSIQKRQEYLYDITRQFIHITSKKYILTIAVM